MSNRYLKLTDLKLLLSRSVVYSSLHPHELQHTRFPGPSSTRACSRSCPLSQWCHTTISSSIIPFSSCLQSFPATGSFLMNQFFTSDGHSIGASASDLKLSSSYFPPQWMATPFFQLLEPKTLDNSSSLDKDGSIMKSCWFYLQNIASNWLLWCWSTPQSSCAKIISILSVFPTYTLIALIPLSTQLLEQTF